MENRLGPEERLAELEQALLAARASEQRCKQELEKLSQRYADDLFAERQLVRQLRADRHRIQQAYEQLRIQKGGFGLRMLALSGFSGFVSALVLCVLYWFLFRPTDAAEAAFSRFAQEELFKYELALSQGHCRQVVQHLEAHAKAPENRLIRPQLDFARKLVSAACRGCP
jgi:hypothetical protein